MLNGGTLNYFAVPWGIINNPLPLVVVTLIEVGLLGAAENYRCAQCCDNSTHALSFYVSRHACVSAICTRLLCSLLSACNAGAHRSAVRLASVVLLQAIWRYASL